MAKGSTSVEFRVPALAKRAVDEWTAAAGEDGVIFWQVSRRGKIWGDRITPKVIWHVVTAGSNHNVSSQSGQFYIVPLILIGFAVSAFPQPGNAGPDYPIRLAAPY